VGKGNSPKWVREQLKHLRWLAGRLRGQDLIGCPLKLLHPLVVGNPHRTAVLKALYGYLRKVTYELEANQDPTLNRLLVPQRRPSDVNKTVDLRKVKRTVREFREPWRSRLQLQAATGLHTTELLRFAQDGKVEKYSGQPGAVAFLQVPHKGKQKHRVALGRSLHRVARRVRESGGFCVQRYYRKVRETGGFCPGWLRHTVATQLVNRGETLAAVATFLGHRSPRTTQRWYAKLAVPRNPFLG
jgi:integrase